jgi:hypothetical protein
MFTRSSSCISATCYCWSCHNIRLMQSILLQEVLTPSILPPVADWISVASLLSLLNSHLCSCRHACRLVGLCSTRHLVAVHKYQSPKFSISRSAVICLTDSLGDVQNQSLKYLLAWYVRTVPTHLLPLCQAVCSVIVLLVHGPPEMTENIIYYFIFIIPFVHLFPCLLFHVFLFHYTYSSSRNGNCSVGITPRLTNDA